MHKQAYDTTNTVAAGCWLTSRWQQSTTMHKSTYTVAACSALLCANRANCPPLDGSSTRQHKGTYTVAACGALLFANRAHLQMAAVDTQQPLGSNNISS
jgi:hypothetical protein